MIILQRNVIRYTLNLKKKKFELIDENLDKVNFKKIKKYDIFIHLAAITMLKVLKLEIS